MDVMRRLADAVKASGLKQTHIARVAGMPTTKLNKILKGRQMATVPEFIDIARAIDLDPGRLFTEGELVIELDELRAAHSASLRVTEILASWLPETAPQSQEPPVALPKRTASRMITPVRAAANPNAELLVEFEKQRQRIPRRAWNRGARMIARAEGSSMDGGPDPIRDGELVYLKPTRSPRTANNRVALMRRDDGLYLKKLEIAGSKIRLVSTSGEPVIQLDPRGENMQVYGYAVDHEHARET